LEWNLRAEFFVYGRSHTFVIFAGLRFSSYLTNNTVRIHWRLQSINTVYVSIVYLLLQPCDTHNVITV
jgi:hypothetical protein